MFKKSTEFQDKIRLIINGGKEIMKKLQKTVCTLLCIMMIFSSLPAVFSASEENHMQKAYIAFSI